MTWTEDLDIFFAGMDAKAAVYSGTGLTIKVYFDQPYAEVGDVESTRPMITCKSSDVPGVGHAATFTIEGTVWRVQSAQPDGTGITAVLLKK